MIKLKAAVIGVGNMGRHHARIYSELEDSNLVAVADLNKELGKEIALKFGCKFYSNYQEMLDKEKPNIVSIATSTSSHHKIGLDCIKRKIDILIEKPIASGVEEAQELINEAEKESVILMVGHVERFNPAVRKVKELIKKGDLGDVVSLNVRRLGLVPPKIKDVNVIVDIGIHDIDIFNYLLERFPEDVFAIGGKALLKDQEDYANVFLKYANHIGGHIQLSWITPVKIRHLTVGGTKAFVDVDYITQKVEVFDHGYTQDFGSFQEFVSKFGSKPHGNILPVKIEEPLKAQIKEFIDSVKKRRVPSISGTDALEALRFALLASEKIKNNNKKR